MKIGGEGGESSRFFIIPLQLKTGRKFESKDLTPYHNEHTTFPFKLAH